MDTKTNVRWVMLHPMDTTYMEQADSNTGNSSTGSSSNSKTDREGGNSISSGKHGT
jgi:hypothetical protein